MSKRMQSVPAAQPMGSVTCAIPAWCTATGRRTVQAGFSLIELMVALTIALVLLMGLGLLFTNTSVARGELDNASRQIESGRYAMQQISDDVRHAGYYGALNNAPTLPGSVPDPCSTTLSVVQDSLGIPLQGYAGAATAAALDPGKLGCLNAAAAYKANTAVLVVRRADTSIAASAPTSGWFNIQVSGCAGDPVPYVLDVDTNPGAFNLHTNLNVPGCLPFTGALPAKITPFYTRIYFISTCSGTDCTAAGADSVPTLKRIDVTPTATPITPIVDGIENLQFDYGIDTTPAPGDGTPDVYTNTAAHAALTPSSLAEWQNVMSLRIYVLARNLDATGSYTDAKTYALGPVNIAPPGDAFKRHAYSQLVRLNNPAGRRE